MGEQDRAVLRTYAQAFDRALREAGVAEGVALEEARGLLGVLASEPHLEHVLARPAIAQEAKKDLLRRVFGGRVLPLMLHLPMLLVDKHRGGEWGRVLAAYVEMVERRQGVYPAQVVTACALGEDQKRDLRSSLEKFTGMRLNIAFREDPALLGGVLFRYEDVMIDDTVRGALRALRMRLNAVKID